MRIDNSAKQRNALNYSARKKQQLDDEETSSSSDDHDSVNLSTEARLLNSLLDSPEFKLVPYPFYFPNATSRNIKQASQISKGIQNRAKSLGIELNYQMIFDLVINRNRLLNQSIEWGQANDAMVTQKTVLHDSEKTLFERIHFTAAREKVDVKSIAAIATEYISYIRNNNIVERSDQDQLKFIAAIIKRNDFHGSESDNMILLSLIDKLLPIYETES